MQTGRTSSGQMMVRDIIAQTGAEIEGHFQHGQRHTGRWIVTRRIIAKPQHTANLCRLMAMQLLPYRPDDVLGLGAEGIVLSHAVGTTLATHLDGDKATGLVSIYAEEDLCFSHGYETLVTGRTVAIVLGIVSSGRTAQRAVELVERHGGSVAAVVALVNRGALQKRLLGDLPFHALCDYALDDWAPGECPLCGEGLPLQKPPTTVHLDG